MPLLSYFVVVGSALMALVYLAGTVLPHDDVPIYISSQIEGLPAPRQQARTDDPISRLKPTTSFAAAYPTVPSTVGQAQPQPDPPLAASAPKTQKPVSRRREPQDSFAKAENGWHDGRRWNDQRRRNDGWQDRGWRDQGWRDRGWGNRGWRDRGWREPSWGWR